MEVTCSSETSVYIQRTIRHYILENRTLHNHSCENLKSDTLNLCSKMCVRNEVKHMYKRFDITLYVYAPVSCMSRHQLVQFLPSGDTSSTPDAIYHWRFAALQQHTAAAFCEARSGVGDVPRGLQCCYVDHRDLRDKVLRQERRPLWSVWQSSVDNAEPHDSTSHNVLQIPLLCVSGWYLEVGLWTGGVTAQEVYKLHTPQQSDTYFQDLSLSLNIGKYTGWTTQHCHVE
jgi:hypothetical protein